MTENFLQLIICISLWLQISMLPICYKSLKSGFISSINYLLKTRLYKLSYWYQQLCIWFILSYLWTQKSLVFVFVSLFHITDICASVRPGLLWPVIKKRLCRRTGTMDKYPQKGNARQNSVRVSQMVLICRNDHKFRLNLF